MLACGANLALADDAFVVKDIQVHGLQRVELGTFFTYLPVKVGESVDDVRVPQIIRSLYRSGSFETVTIARDGDVLVVRVEELPTISDITFDGNKQIKTEQLMDALKNMGFTKGELLNPSSLKTIKREMEQQYFAHGKYGVKMNYKIVRMPRNRVDVKFKITEGDAATIEQINIVGNTLFGDQELLEQFELTTSNFWTVFSDRDQYAKEKLSGDLEKLRSYYMDRGYLKYQNTSSQVSITPEKDKVYITVNINEGAQYKVKEIKFAGNLILDEAVLRSLVPLREGDTYSAAFLTFAETSISRTLGLYGYAFAKVTTQPDADDEKKEVSITLMVEPGLRTYVNRVQIAGNETTNDHVFRREMRMMEGSSFSNDQIDRSKTLLERLPFVEEVKVESPKVEGSEDLVDIDVKIKERNAGQFTAGLGYSDYLGLSFQTGISHDNFLGSGNRVAFNIQQSKAIKNYSLSYTDPYFTIDGVSLGGQVFYRATDYGELNIVGQSLDSIGARLNLGIPYNEVSRFTTGVGLQSSTLKSGGGSTNLQLQELFDSVNQNIEEDPDLDFNILTLNVGWLRNTTNRGIFPDRGTMQQASVEFSVPGSKFEYYKVNYNLEHYWGFAQGFSLLTRFNASYGNGYGDTEELPYFERYYAGGTGSLRGFERNVVGPRQISRFPTCSASVPGTDPSDNAGVSCPPLPAQFDTIVVGSNRAVGGNARVLGGWDLIFPTPFAKESRSVRTSLFIDFANLWDTEFDRLKYAPPVLQQAQFDKIPDNSDDTLWRASYGLSLQWLSPMGPIGFHLSRPIRKEDGDRLENFGFTIGQTF